jgi:dihydrofolate reductase
MARIIVTEFISLDGVIEDPGGSEGFRYGGWTFEFPGEERYGFKGEETFASDALLLGRKTYEGFAEAWPSRDGEFADKFNSMPKVVVSTTLDSPAWQNTSVVRDLDAVRKLKETEDGTYVVHGSAQLVQSLLDADLVDQLNLMVFPVVLGQGKRLFGETGDKLPFELAESRTADDNVLILVYRRAA